MGLIIWRESISVHVYKETHRFTYWRITVLEELTVQSSCSKIKTTAIFEDFLIFLRFLIFKIFNIASPCKIIPKIVLTIFLRRQKIKISFDS